MRIKSLSRRDAWVNINHITHFEIKVVKQPTKRISHDVVAYLDAIKSEYNITESETHIVPDQVIVTVHRGTHEECEQFIEEKIRQQTISEWIGYLVAGSVGAVLAAVITVVLTLLFLQS